MCNSMMKASNLRFEQEKKSFLNWSLNTLTDIS